MITSQIIDKRNHKIHNKFEAVTVDLIAQFGKDFRSVKDWVDSHPEYLLILLSDHGGDWEDDEVLSTHGPSAGGNEAFITFYNPQIVPPPKQYQWIETGTFNLESQFTSIS